MYGFLSVVGFRIKEGIKQLRKACCQQNCECSEVKTNLEGTFSFVQLMGSYHIWNPER